VAPNDYLRFFGEKIFDNFFSGLRNDLRREPAIFSLLPSPAASGYLDRRLRVIRMKGIGREFARGRN
jgi:hypothetical protein